MRNDTSVSWFALLLAGIALVSTASAQDVTTIPNTTNACIIETYKFYSPSTAVPTLIFIDRRLTFNPQIGCTTAAMNNALCNRDPNGGPMGEPLLVASVSTAQIAGSPSCSWNCAAAGCGTIVTDGSLGLPVELMEFGLDPADVDDPADQDERETDQR